jgi:ATP-binding cassette, subfamily G (WHITE), member 2, SNQ2
LRACLLGANLHKQPGEMCLVLGVPGSGCSTFLKVIANHTRREYAKITGDVEYAGITAAEMEKHYGGEVAYNEEGMHH